MKKKLRLPESKRSLNSDSTSRVVQISIDVEIPEDTDSQDVINIIQQYVPQGDFNIVGAEVVDDLTDVYEDQYPDLLKFR